MPVYCVWLSRQAKVRNHGLLLLSYYKYQESIIMHHGGGGGGGSLIKQKNESSDLPKRKILYDLKLHTIFRPSAIWDKIESQMIDSDLTGVELKSRNQ